MWTYIDGGAIRNCVIGQQKTFVKKFIPCMIPFSQWQREKYRGEKKNDKTNGIVLIEHAFNFRFGYAPS
jgi:hypothetical protein